MMSDPCFHGGFASLVSLARTRCRVSSGMMTWRRARDFGCFFYMPALIPAGVMVLWRCLETRGRLLVSLCFKFRRSFLGRTPGGIPAQMRPLAFVCIVSVPDWLAPPAGLVLVVQCRCMGCRSPRTLFDCTHGFERLGCAAGRTGLGGQMKMDGMPVTQNMQRVLESQLGDMLGLLMAGLVIRGPKPSELSF